MEFGEFSKANYSISLDTKSQLFSARSNDNPNNRYHLAHRFAWDVLCESPL